jgi:hypothetical protein
MNSFHSLFIQNLFLSTTTMVLRGKSSSSSSTPAAPSVAAGRLPILLQITDATLAAGPVGQPLPLHIQPLLEPPCPAAASAYSTSSGAALYSYLADPLTSLFHRLLGTKVAASGVIVLHSHGIYVNEGWKLAISRLLNDLLKVPKVCFVSTLHTLPALISHSHSVLVVHFVSSSSSSSCDDDNDDNGINNYHREDEVQCMVTAVDHDPLEYTFQSVPRRRRRRRTRTAGRSNNNDNEQEQENENEEEEEDEETMDDDDDGAVVRAICLSLIACPRSHRKSAIQNIIVDHPNNDDEQARQHGTRIVRKLYDYLTSTSRDDDLPRSDDDNDVLVPIRRDEIKALAPFIGLVEFKSTFRLSYLGASVLASSSCRRDWPWHDINGI